MYSLDTVVSSVRGLVAITQAIKQRIFGRTSENIAASDRIGAQWLVATTPVREAGMSQGIWKGIIQRKLPGEPAP